MYFTFLQHFSLYKNIFSHIGSSNGHTDSESAGRPLSPLLTDEESGTWPVKGVGQGLVAYWWRVEAQAQDSRILIQDLIVLSWVALGVSPLSCACYR